MLKTLGLQDQQAVVESGSLSEQTAPVYDGRERRSTPRICDPFPARVRGIGDDGEPFNIFTVLDNLSAGGLYLRMRLSPKEGTALSISFSLTMLNAEEKGAQSVLVRGKILRIEPKPGGAKGVALSILRHKFV